MGLEKGKDYLYFFTSVQLLTKTKTFPAGVYLFKVNNENKRTM